MSLSAIPLYTSPSGTVYSLEFDPSSHGSSPCSTTMPPPPVASHSLPSGGGGLSCLFFSPATAAAPPRAPAHDKLGMLWHDRSDNQCLASGGYSHFHTPSSLKWRDLHHHHYRSLVSIFEGPSSSSPSQSPPASWMAGHDRDCLFAGFVRNTLGSCVGYAPATSPWPEVGTGELAFELNENLTETSPACEPYAQEPGQIHVRAQLGHPRVAPKIAVPIPLFLSLFKPLHDLVRSSRVWAVNVRMVQNGSKPQQVIIRLVKGPTNASMASGQKHMPYVCKGLVKPSSIGVPDHESI